MKHVVLLLSFALAVQAQVRYVSSSGNDTANTCSSDSSPCASISYAFGQAVSGMSNVLLRKSNPIMGASRRKGRKGRRGQGETPTR